MLHNVTLCQDEMLEGLEKCVGPARVLAGCDTVDVGGARLFRGSDRANLVSINTDIRATESRQSQCISIIDSMQSTLPIPLNLGLGAGQQLKTGLRH